MGMIDSSLRFSAAQAVTGLGDIASTNNVDLGALSPSNDTGLAQDLGPVVTCTSAAASGGAATVQAVLQDSADGVTFTDALAGAVFPVASAVPGALLLGAALPVGLRRYLRVVYRIGTAALTAGAFSAFISLDLQANTAKPGGFRVQ